ncbi:2-(3-amino-3-carboxypropyl)histidine synthase subunit 2-like [Hydractinia symbiolongicarpus]|uniref:2-(3-amino-3-carboxypropyl)histidine synthase subunit 2-like n=1 Tax=Hydractinia symbiolongicarpus TaxID=13093 RepID=UPI0025507E28|nr:2-(3-amino-3-carboxypropyl)histidine synthase subunit 2-like [Hydractinia symbiolongicarpus]
MASSTLFSSGDDIVGKKYSVLQINIDVDLAHYFEIDRCVEFINNNNFASTALQFPDELMCYASYVSNAIEDRIHQKVFVLADTSYGSCCVDEVSAAHMNADSLIHFGHSCLSRSESLPVLYVFGKSDINPDDFLLKFTGIFPDTEEKVIIFYDVQYYHAVNIVKDTLLTTFCNAILTELEPAKKSIESSVDEVEKKSESILGRSYSLLTDLSHYKIVYIGSEGLTLHNLLITFSKNQFYSYNPISKSMRRETVNVNKMLMKRYFLIEKAKDAQIVGIVMGTLGVARYKEMVTRLKSVLTHAEKKFYTFVVGKINVAKLANFMEIDIFVLIACPENSLIDSKDFYKPIVTPFEMEIACLKTREWTGDYHADFRLLLPGSSLHVHVKDDSINNEEPEYSLITGKLRKNLNLSKQSNTTDVALRNQERQLTEQCTSAVDYLASRTWQGLEVRSGQTEVKQVEEGRAGIAMSYTHEPEQ